MATYRQPPVKVRGILVTPLNPVKPCCWPNVARASNGNDTFGDAVSGRERLASDGHGSPIPQGRKPAQPLSERGFRPVPARNGVGLTGAGPGWDCLDHRAA